jgi:hypothetical protein
MIGAQTRTSPMLANATLDQIYAITTPQTKTNDLKSLGHAMLQDEYWLLKVRKSQGR